MFFGNHGIVKVHTPTRTVELVEYGYHGASDCFRAVSRLRGLEAPDSVHAYLNGPLADLHVLHGELGPTPALSIMLAGGVVFRNTPLETGHVFGVVIIGEVGPFRERLGAQWPSATIHPRTRQSSPVDLPAALRGAAQLRP